MEEPTLGSLEETSQNKSDLRSVLQELIAAHGADTVERELRSIEAAELVENPRSRGRPVGPAINDWPSLSEAAAIWRERGGGPVWPALLAVAKSLPGESESNARRLLNRLRSGGRSSEFKRAGIGDFWMAAWDRKIHRLITRAGPGYKQVFFSEIITFIARDLDPDYDTVFTDILLRCIPPLTIDDMDLLVQHSQVIAAIRYSLDNKGAPGIDGPDFADIEAYGVERWLAELALALRQGDLPAGANQTSVYTEGQLPPP